MRKWFILFVSVAAMTTFAPAASVAQGIVVEVPGAGVRIGDPPRRERREGWKEREVRGGSSCRTVTVTEDTPYGTRSRTKKECD